LYLKSNLGYLFMYCIHCGNKLTGNAKFCHSCGLEVVDEKPAGDNAVSQEIEPKEETDKPNLPNEHEDDALVSEKIDIKRKTVEQNFRPAVVYKRIANFFLDLMFYYAFALIVGVVIGVMGFADQLTPVYDKLLGAILYYFYYLISESSMDKSPAKFITSTKVIKRDGSKPTFKDYAVRSLVRVFLIEALSFVTTKNAGNPIGWHDSTAGTLVVDDPPKHWNK